MVCTKNIYLSIYWLWIDVNNWEKIKNIIIKTKITKILDVLTEGRIKNTRFEHGSVESVVYNASWFGCTHGVSFSYWGNALYFRWFQSTPQPSGTETSDEFLLPHNGVKWPGVQTLGLLYLRLMVINIWYHSSWTRSHDSWQEGKISLLFILIRVLQCVKISIQSAWYQLKSYCFLIKIFGLIRFTRSELGRGTWKEGKSDKD